MVVWPFPTSNHDGSDMTTIRASNIDCSTNDKQLMEEALRRARACRFSFGTVPDSIEQAIFTALSRGTRDVHGIMRAVSQQLPAK